MYAGLIEVRVLISYMNIHTLKSIRQRSPQDHASQSKDT